MGEEVRREGLLPDTKVCKYVTVHLPLPLSILHEHSTTATAITLTIQICNKVVLFIGQWDGFIRG